MKQWFLILFSSLLLTTGAKSQSGNDNKEVMALIDSANKYLCVCDTISAIPILESIEKNFSNDGYILVTNRILSDFYLSQGRVAEAKQKLFYAISYNPENSMPVRGPYVCDKHTFWVENVTGRAEICVSLFCLYLGQQMFDSAFYYLNLADGKYFPYSGCINGKLMYKSHLSTYFADYYLAIGDTTKAINHLLDYILVLDGNIETITEKLKTILLQKYSREEIINEMKTGFRKVSYKTLRGERMEIDFTFFNHNVRFWWTRRSKSDGKEFCREILKSMFFD